LHLFNGIEPGPDIAPLVAGRIDEGLIEAHWDDVLRLGTSIRTGVVSASIMLERLGSYPRANGLALALREIGRVERTCSRSTGSSSPNSVAAPPANSTREKRKMP
jgi:TnpA family transposase